MDLKAVFKKILASRWLIFGTAVLAVYSLAGFLLLPHLASNYLKEYAQMQLAHELTLRKLRFNPFTFTVEVEGLDLKSTKQAPLLSVDYFSANFDALASLQKQAWTFSSIKISDPFLRVVVQTDGRTNLSMLFKDMKIGNHGPTQQGAKRSVPKFLLEDVMLQGGKINFVDRRVSPAAKVLLRSFALDLEELTTLPDLTGGYTISDFRSRGI